ncbi:hypothetical protein CFR78_11640 [Komagataeibacter rhaeticus]|uniref:hypothetical protein n=1 Tax=Komagataeibacter rhaeticus TaxID=215221 RepID=UPI0004D6255D|nr:hypothetical protein [Komagataeibacter rhaeticus]KDU96576.1 hypothetical protein GLUCORHAEAF1_01115 [Komagataeibacter rhaeticus AF1]PYD52966.1 hypothetical protein CFR78_11640 [Komagataeibacter rhaeticus]
MPFFFTRWDATHEGAHAPHACKPDLYRESGIFLFMDYAQSEAVFIFYYKIQENHSGTPIPDGNGHFAMPAAVRRFPEYSSYLPMAP